MEKFTEVILQSDADLLNDADISNALIAYAHFDYVNFDVISLLLKASLKKLKQMNILSVTAIVHSLAKLDIANS